MQTFRRLTFAFALFLVLIVILADQGRVGAIFGFLIDFPYGDKVGHLMLYGILALLVSLGFSPARARLPMVHPLTSSLIIAGIAALEEISQIFVPSRSADLIDLLAGWLGIFIFGELGALARRRLAFSQVKKIS